MSLMAQMTFLQTAIVGLHTERWSLFGLIINWHGYGNENLHSCCVFMPILKGGVCYFW